MHDFHYNIIKPKYGVKIELCYQDTNSYIYNVKTENFYEDMKSMREKFDTSDYPNEQKDEYNVKIMKEFFALRSKMYAYKIGDKENKISKGRITFDDYKNCLFKEKITYRTMNPIRREKNEIYTVEVNQIALRTYDNKRITFGVKPAILPITWPSQATTYHPQQPPLTSQLVAPGSYSMKPVPKPAFYIYCIHLGTPLGAQDRNPKRREIPRKDIAHPNGLQFEYQGTPEENKGRKPPQALVRTPAHERKKKKNSARGSITARPWHKTRKRMLSHGISHGLCWGAIRAIAWSDFGKPWRAGIRMAGPGIEPGLAFEEGGGVLLHRTRQQYGVATQRYDGKHLADQRLITYLPAGKTADRKPLAALATQINTTSYFTASCAANQIPQRNYLTISALYSNILCDRCWISRKEDGNSRKVQSIVAAIVVSLFALSVSAIMNGCFKPTDALLLCTASLMTATSSCFVLGTYMS
ncbi:hypothetical protein PR048_012369 [Dryococelus australis]|uniref:Uncharacterized protein n=1 Tax=Dryococelus australis TaxID=614101 RepID=A0ABQ9HPE2_9NEOP|nr:hypothetical protein PR048_012369 [Dryococelus australis]